MLSESNHSRDVAGLTYVYPVISRRSNGLSIGINLNPNNACNWHCIYCQVPELVRGSAPAIDLELLDKELHQLLEDVLQGDFYNRFEVPEKQRKIRDVAISGNGEPTSADKFTAVIDLLGNVLTQTGLLGKVSIVLITNGSLMHQTRVQQGLIQLAQLNGEIWFKLDRATDSGIREINNASYNLRQLRENLGIAVQHCSVWIQTSLFALDGKPPSDQEWQFYLKFLASFQLESKQSIAGVLLYGLARVSMQPDASRLTRLPDQTMQQYADSIRRLGYEVKVSP